MTWLTSHIVFLFATLAYASPQTFSPVPSEAACVHFEVGYSLGTHKGSADKISGELQIDLKNLSKSSGELKVSVLDIKASESKMSCHLREALSLNYLTSDYPDRHVCNSEDELPREGKNKPEFTDVSMKLLRAFDARYEEKILSQIHADIEWTIHGKKQIQKNVELSLANEPASALRVKATIPLKLSDFGVSVKNLLFIKVKDDVLVQVNCLFK